MNQFMILLCTELKNKKSTLHLKPIQVDRILDSV